MIEKIKLLISKIKSKILDLFNKLFNKSKTATSDFKYDKRKVKKRWQ
jgi:hypothetical protein